MYVDLGTYLQELEAKPLGGPELVNLRVTQQDHPNLRAYRDHLGVTRLCTSDVNPTCDSIHILHRTDTDGSSLEVMPFLNEKQVQVFADPPIYIVGQRNPYGFGEVPLPDWQDLLEDANLGPVVISKVRRYLKAHPPISYHDVPD